MKKALSLVVILTLLCFPVSGFCSVTDGVVGAIEGARKGYPLTAGVYGGAGLGVAVGAFR
ncbi:MAG: hypothetical protein LBB37_02665 [Endomicrobium sp.]|jgi:hypothetical protein|nr:hypothetical protein [Endomicrobium sp.]